MSNRRYDYDPHLFDRCGDRNLGIRDVKHAILNATTCQPYQDPKRPPTPGATQWSVFGPALDGDALRVGVDLIRNHLGMRALLITVMGA